MVALLLPPVVFTVMSMLSAWVDGEDSEEKEIDGAAILRREGEKIRVRDRFFCVIELAYQALR